MQMYCVDMRIIVKVITRDGKTPIRYGVTLPRTSTVTELTNSLSHLCGIAPDGKV